MSEEVENLGQESAVESETAEIPSEPKVESPVEVAGVNQESTEPVAAKPSDEDDFEKALTSGVVEDEELEEEKEKSSFENFDFNKKFEFQDFNNVYLVEFEDGNIEEVKEDSVHNIVDKFKDKAIKSITSKSSTVTSIFEGSILQTKKDQPEQGSDEAATNEEPEKSEK